MGQNEFRTIGWDEELEEIFDPRIHPQMKATLIFRQVGNRFTVLTAFTEPETIILGNIAQYYSRDEDAITTFTSLENALRDSRGNSIPGNSRVSIIGHVRDLRSKIELLGGYTIQNVREKGYRLIVG